MLLKQFGDLIRWGETSVFITIPFPKDNLVCSAVQEHIKPIPRAKPCLSFPLPQI